MASETDHRVMNSLQFVASLLHLQSRIVHAPESADQLAIAANRVAAVGRVHRHFATHAGIAKADPTWTGLLLIDPDGDSLSDRES